MAARKTMIIALACGILAALLSWAYLELLERKYAENSNPVPVLVARGYITKGTLVKERMVQVVKIPRQYIQPSALTSIKELYDERNKNIYINLLPILENEQIVMSKLANVKNELGLTIAIPEGKTAVPLPVDEVTTLGGLLSPGNRVNVLCTFISERGGKSTNSTSTIFQNVEILSVGGRIVGETLSQGETKGSTGESSKPAVLTLALTPEEATMLTFARETGNITLALRQTGDDTFLNLPTVELENVVSGRGGKVTSAEKMKALQYIEQMQKDQ